MTSCSGQPILGVGSVGKRDRNSGRSRCCSVYGCKSTVVDGPTFDESTFLHKIPKNPTARRQWIAFIRCTRKNFTPTIHSMVCSKHFKRDDYENAMEYDFHKSQNILTRARLKSSAVPSVRPALPTNKAVMPSPSAVERDKRMLARQRDEYIQTALNSLNDAEDIVYVKQEVESEEMESEKSDAEEETDEYIEEMMKIDVINDPDWNTGEDSKDERADESAEKALNWCKADMPERRKYLSSIDSLLELVLVCKKCTAVGQEQVKFRFVEQGCVIRFYLTCKLCSAQWTWQTMGDKRADAVVVNTAIADSIVNSGLQHRKVVEFMKANNISCFETCYLYHYKRPLDEPLATESWEKEEKD